MKRIRNTYDAIGALRTNGMSLIVTHNGDFIDFSPCPHLVTLQLLIEGKIKPDTSRGATASVYVLAPYCATHQTIDFAFSQTRGIPSAIL